MPGPYSSFASPPEKYGDPTRRELPKQLPCILCFSGMSGRSMVLLFLLISSCWFQFLSSFSPLP